MNHNALIQTRVNQTWGFQKLCQGWEATVMEIELIKNRLLERHFLSS